MDSRQNMTEKEQIYLPFFDQKIKSRKILKEIKEKNSAAKFYGWSLKENYLYACYLRKMQHIVLDPALRKEVQIFRRMTGLIKTRNVEQIKSHHQKMMLKHKELDRIIKHFEREVAKALSSCPDLIAQYGELDQCISSFFERESSCIDRITHDRISNVSAQAESQQKSLTCEESSQKKIQIQKESVWEVKIEEESDMIYLLSDCWRLREAANIKFEQEALN